MQPDEDINNKNIFFGMYKVLFNYS